VGAFARVVGIGAVCSLAAACGIVTGLNGYATGEAADASLATGHDSSTSRPLDGAGQSDTDESSPLGMMDATDAESPDEAGDASEDAVEEGEESDGGELEAGADASDAGSPMSDGGHEGGCGATDTVENCGACGVSCNTSHASDAGCNGTSCSYSCSAGYADCDPASPNTGGCQTPTNTLAHCAGCAACNTTTGTPTCNGTTCSYACGNLLLDCNAAVAPDTDGCETSATSTSTCGGCLNKCGATNGGTYSSAGCNGTSCTYACDNGHYDCDSTTAPNTDGCETPESTTNCGGCGTVCGSTNGATFSADTCSTSTNSCAYTCGSGHYDCNASTPPNTDGCETPESATNCGKCGQACGTTNTSTFSGETCVNNSCNYTCDSNRWDCNVGTAPDQDGCECTGTGCCGGSCQYGHPTATGLSGGAATTYYDCSATVTHSATEAQLACQAYTGGTCTTSSTCCGFVLLGACVGTTATAYCGTSYCWDYGAQNSGSVQSGTSVSCSGSVASW
jgi:hypothetical protein